MKQVYFFQLNIEADNTHLGETGYFINVLAEWPRSKYSSGKPIVYIKILADNSDDSAMDIAERHFAEIAKAELIAQARATLISEGEPTGNPVLDRYTEKENDLQIQETLS